MSSGVILVFSWGFLGWVFLSLCCLWEMAAWLRCCF